MRTSALLVAAATLAFVASAPAAPDETVEISVRDLVRGPGQATPFAEDTALHAEGSSGGMRLPVDEGTWDEMGRQAAIPEGELPEILEALTGEDKITLTMHGDRLFVPSAQAPAIRAALARIRGLRPVAVDLEYALEASVEGGWRTILAGREPVAPGHVKVFADAADRSYLADFDVEIAAASEIPDPIALVQRSGPVLVLRLLPLPGREAVIIDAQALVAEPMDLPPIQPRHADMAPMDRAGLARDEVRVALRAEPGKTAEHSWTGRNGRTVRLRLTPRWAPRPADAGTGALLWSPVLGQHLVSRRFVGYRLRAAGSEANERWPMFGSSEESSIETPDRVAARFDGKDVRLTGPTPGGLLALSGTGAAAVRDAYVAGLDEEFRSVRVEVKVHDVAAGAAGPEGGRELFRASGPLLADLGACYARSETRAFLQDGDVEVAQASSIVDPVLGLLTVGQFCNVKVVEGADGASAALDLDLQLSRLESMAEQTIPVLGSGGRAAVGTMNDGKGDHTLVMGRSGGEAGRERTTYVLEMPRVREVRMNGLFPLGPEGRIVLRRTAPGFLGEGRELLVEITVR